jgi:hypothetical protein
LVGTYELLMMVIRSSQTAAVNTPEGASAAETVGRRHDPAGMAGPVTDLDDLRGQLHVALVLPWVSAGGRRLPGLKRLGPWPVIKDHMPALLPLICTMPITSPVRSNRYGP